MYGAALEVYLRHTDLSEAITEAKRQREIIQRAEEEARRREEAKVRAEQPVQEEEPIIHQPEEQEPEKPIMEEQAVQTEALPPQPTAQVQKPTGKVYTDTLTITTTPELSEQLLQYVENHGITYDSLTYRVQIDAKFRGTKEQLTDFHRAMEANGIGFEKQKKVEQNAG